MSTLMRKHSKKKGMPPGTMLHVGKQLDKQAIISIMDYDADNFKQRKGYIDQFVKNIPQETVTWLNFEGVHDITAIKATGHKLGLHSLTMEDIVHTGQRPKMEDYGDYLFLVTKMLRYNKNQNCIESQQVSMVLGKGYLMTFQETDWDVFELIRQRIIKDQGCIRSRGNDYLAYALLDAIVDHYFEILEHFGDRIEEVEEELLTDPKQQTLSEIHQIKRNFIVMRKSIWPLREMINHLHSSDSDLIDDSTKVYIRDVYDHAVQVIDTQESSRDLVSGMLEIYLSSMSNKMNSVMKVLTVIATIFIPLTFVTGIFGMNFTNMPELKMGWMYPFGFWAIIIAVISGMVWHFRKNKWL